MRHAPLSTPRRGSGPQGAVRGNRWPSAVAAIAAVAGLAAVGAPAAATAAAAPANSFKQTNLIANKASLKPRLVDPNLVNAWGLASGPTPIWVSDNGTGKASVYSGGIKGSAVMLDLTVPVPGGEPTGQVFNSTRDFPVGGAKGSPALFIVSTNSIGSHLSAGQIEAWNPSLTKFVVETSPTGGPGGKTPKGAVFTGLALTTTAKAGPELLAADLTNAKVDVFNKNFALVKTPTEFRDPKIPAGYAPYGIQTLGGKIYVSYGKQSLPQKTRVVFGPGLGFVDVYSANGVLLHHLVSGGPSSPLNAPWGLAIAPKGFGPFGGDLLVGNLGNGWINAFNPTTGKHLGTLDDSLGYPITIPGLWGLRVGNSMFGGSSSIVFSAGPANYRNGLVGKLTPG